MPLARARKTAVVTAKAMLELVKVTAATYLGTEMFAGSADEVLLTCAIYIGQAEERPMTAAKVAGYIGMPRPTAIRKLTAMKLRGLVEVSSSGQWTVKDTAKLRRVAEARARVIHRAAEELSKMDGSAVARSGEDVSR